MNSTQQNNNPFIQNQHLHCIRIFTTNYIPLPSHSSLNLSLSSCLLNDNGYTLVTGASGSGKSSLLAHLWTKKDELQVGTANSVNPPHFFIHFFGTSHNSLSSMLIHLYEDINSVLHEKLPFPKASELLTSCPKFLDAISAQGGIVIILDEVNMIEEEYQNLHWLPRVLPPRVHIIVSATSNEGSGSEEMKTLHAREVIIPLLQENDKRELMSKYLLSNETNNLASHKLSDNFLFLSTSLNLLCNSTTLQQSSEDIMSSEDIPSLFQKILSRLEDKHGIELTKKVLLLITVSRTGIEEATIRQITNVASTQLLPLLSAILPTKLISDEKLLLNRSLTQAIRHRYSAEDVKTVQRELINYYKSSPFSPQIAYELPWLLSELIKNNPTDQKLQQELVNILVNLNNINSFNSHPSLQHDLFLYWNALKKLNKKWDLQLYVAPISLIYKKAKDTNQPLLHHIATWFLYAGCPIYNHVQKQFSKLRARLALKEQAKLSPHPKCYMCKERNKKKFLAGKSGLTLCIACENKNKMMMDQWDSVTTIDGCVALVTGARIKIGYYIALRLLKSGATVIVTTRFPYDAALRYSKEPDFEIWKNKLHIYGIDFRHIPSVNQFISHVLVRYKRLDMLINNAAQTKRRPRAYYHEVVNRERKLLCGEEQNNHSYLIKNFTADPYLIQGAEEGERKNKRIKIERERKDESALVPVMAMDTSLLDPSLPLSAALTQVPLHPMDIKERDDEMFPPGLVDEHNEPLDIRPSTTWTQQIHEISTVELLEVQIVNSTVPFMLISAFAPILEEAAIVSHHKRAFVVNVTAVEGNFSNVKQNGCHAHTNMAKAALNMLTKSISVTFAAKNIYTTAVDTGWCTEMRYVPMDKRDERGVPLEPVPLTDKDGAARVLYPIYVGLTSATPPPYGVLYHDYEVKPFE